MQWGDAAPSTGAHRELAHRVTRLHLRGGLGARTTDRARSLRVFLPRNAARGLASYFAGQDSLLSGVEVRAARKKRRRRPAADPRRIALPAPSPELRGARATGNGE